MDNVSNEIFVSSHLGNMLDMRVVAVPVVFLCVLPGQVTGAHFLTD